MASVAQSYVAHIIIPYLPLSENWIYEQIHRHQRYPPLILTPYTRNLELFPLPSGRIISLSGRPIAKRIKSRLSRLLTRIPAPSYIEAVQRYDARLIHAHFGDVGWKHLYVAQRTGRPLITSFYGYDIEMLSRKPEWAPRLKELFLFGRAFVCLGEWMRGKIIDLGCPPEKALVLPFGVNLERFHFRPRIWKGIESIHVIMVANFVPKKGHAIALEALARVRRTFPQVQLWLVGDGPLRPQIEEQIRSLELETAVRMVGSVAYPLAGELGEQAHLFLLPSHTAPDGNQEGLPMVLIEAQAIGLPTLSTFHACIPEVVAHGESGLLATEGDVETLVAHWLALLTHPERWPAMGARGREIIEERYSAATQAAKLEDLYEQLIA